MTLLSIFGDETKRAAHLAALRWRFGGHAQRFINEMHKELPSQPPTARRTLVLFAHFDPQGIVDPYVVYYLRSLYGLNASIILVSGSPVLAPESVMPILDLCVGIYTRRTLSLDFGCHHLAWSIMTERGWNLDQFDRVVLANDSVYGPFFPLEEMWQKFRDADMYGALESAEQSRHLQSFFLAWDLNPCTRGFLTYFWNNFQYIVDKQRLIRRYEIGLSKRARKSGLEVKPFVSLGDIEATYPHVPDHPWADRFDGRPINNSLYFWDGLIEHLRFPFLKTVLARQNDPWHDSMYNLRDFLEKRSNYPYELIESNLDRLGCGPRSWSKPK